MTPSSTKTENQKRENHARECATNESKKTQSSASEPITSPLQNLDYEQIKFKCGIEIHQQLEGKKLFSDTPTLIRDDEPHFSLQRKLRAVVGETGMIDTAAQAEQKRQKVFTYHGYSDTIGLVELDEEPPHAINEQAVYTALQIGMLLKADIVDEIQIMRKTVIDGSNTSGFQRTALIAQDGYILTADNTKIDIPTIILEEEAAKIVSQSATEATYNLSRLGIPLIELGTAPQITSPIMAKEVATSLGSMLRSTGRVKRGLGTIRQDINISLMGGNRVEIKGAQDLAGIPTLCDYEIIRQLTIHQLQPKFAQMHIGPVIEIQQCLAHCEGDLIKKSLASGKTACAVRVTNAAGVIGTELQPGKRVGTDWSDFAKIHAGIGGLIHSDEQLDKYKLTSEHKEKIQSLLHINPQSHDAFLIILDSKQTCLQAFDAITKRLAQLREGVPKEVRKANPDYTTSYMRPMPGQARMYPETDVAPLRVDTTNVILPELLDQKIERYMSLLGLATDLATSIARGEQSELFEHMCKSTKLAPATIAEILLSTPKILQRKHNIAYIPTDNEFQYVIRVLHEGKIALASIGDIFVDVAKNRTTIEQAVSKFLLLSDAELERIVATVLAEFPNSPQGLLMGKIMQRAAGKADGKKVGILLAQKQQ